MTSFSNAIIFVGNTGVGKSYICNQIFRLNQSSERFKSSDSNTSVTQTIQHGKLTVNGKTYTLVDSPGFFDTNGGGCDGENVCKLVKVLESSDEIYAVVFVYTDRFHLPHRIWFDRIKDLVSTAYRGNILFVHNKLGQLDLETKIENLNDIKGQIGFKPLYFWFSHSGNDGQYKDLLEQALKLVPFKLSNLIVPEICYEKTATSEEYEEEISKVTNDEGKLVTETKDTSHYEDDKSFWGVVTSISTRNKATKWVSSTAEEKKHISKDVVRRQVNVYKNIYKVRFDGTRDLFKKELIREREEVYGLAGFII